MAKVSYIDLPPEFKDIYKKNLNIGDRFVLPYVRIVPIISKRYRIPGITLRSVLPDATQVWNNLNPTVQYDWGVVGSQNNKTGFSVFVREYCLRKKYGFSLSFSPNSLHQGKVGHLKIESPATKLHIVQDHPVFYYIDKKVRGTKDQREPTLITEFVHLPIEIYFNYKSDLYSIDLNSKAEVYIEITSNYQGRDIITIKKIDINLSQDWISNYFVVNEIFGVFRSYRIGINLQYVRGDLYIDNFKVVHTGRNWCRDTECNDINQSFTKAYYQISKNWIAEEIENGSQFESEYVDF